MTLQWVGGSWEEMAWAFIASSKPDAAGTTDLRHIHFRRETTMSYRFEAGRIYRMPTHFGPAPGPRQLPDDVAADPKRSPRRLSVAASFLTDPVALERHLPEGFT